MNNKFYTGQSSDFLYVSINFTDKYIKLTFDNYIKEQKKPIYWQYQDIRIVTAADNNQQGVITNINDNNARLYIADNSNFKLLKRKLPIIQIYYGDFKSFIKNNISLFITIALLLVAMPYIISFSATKVSDKFFDDFGKKTLNYFINKKNNCNDSIGRQELNKLVRKLTNDNKVYNVFVVKKDVVNAIALPGNNIVIFSALLDKINHLEELAIVIAHEVAHIKYQHLKELYIKNIIFSSVFNSTSELISIFLSAQYSQENEQEADIFAINLMKKYSISSKYFVSLFNILELSNPSLELPYISSHPKTTDRINLMMKELKNIKSSIALSFRDVSIKNIKNICNNI
jgi:Zn-dependent protease with chaperone function